MHSSQTNVKPAAWAVALAFALIYTAWGTTYLAIKIGVRDEQLPPLLFGGARATVAGLLVLGFQALCGQKLRISRGELLHVFTASLFLFLFGNGMISIAQKTVDSGVAAVLVATTPLWLGLFAMSWPGGERLTVRGWLGLVVGMAGIPILLGPRLHDPEAFVRDFGPLLVLGSAASWALGSLVLRRMRLEASRLTAAGYQMLIGGLGLLAVGAISGETHELPERITLGAVGVFFYLLIVGSLIGFIAFNWLLGHVSASKVGTYAYVNPVVAVLVGWLAGEEMNGWIASGIGVILFGVFLVRGGERPAESTPLAEAEPEIAARQPVEAT